jgi:hypothetical protein
MTLPPGHIRTPEIDDFCYIDRIYSVFFGSASTEIIRANLDPSNISYAEQMYGCRMPREVFIPLFEILKPVHHGVHIRTPEDLDALADDPVVMDLTQFDAHTRDQRRSFHLKFADRSKSIDWRSLTELYNGVEPESRKVIKGFFKYCLGFNLRKLMETQALALAVPEALQAKTAPFLLDGQRMVNCDLAKSPVPEAQFCRQFEIHIRRQMNKVVHYVGTAGTAEIAIAKALACIHIPSKRFPFPMYTDAQRIRAYPFMTHITIKLDGRPLIEGKIEYRQVPTMHRNAGVLVGYLPRVDKINWNRELITSPDQEPHRMTIRAFEASLFRAEAALGLTSSKGRYLEDSLGL